MKQWNKIFKQLTLLTQLGLSLVTPVLLSLLLCWYLTAKKGMGGWIFIPGFLLGLGASAMTAYKFYLSEAKKSKKDEDNKKVSFNSHS